LTGHSLMRPFLLRFGIQNRIGATDETEGACHSVPKHPKSSLAGAGPAWRTRSGEKCARNASAIRSLAALSLTCADSGPSGVISGGRGAPEACASAFTMRSTAAAHARSHACVKSPNVELDEGAVRDDVIPLLAGARSAAQSRTSAPKSRIARML
jgi:hypothetical protein